MCGRIGSSMPRAELLETYHWLRDAPEDEPRYNIAPTDPVLAVGPDRAEIVRWGIEGSKGGLFNLRSETALTQPYYRDMLLGQRVLVPASHFLNGENSVSSGSRSPSHARTASSSIWP